MVLQALDFSNCQQAKTTALYEFQTQSVSGTTADAANGQIAFIRLIMMQNHLPTRI